MRHFCFQEYLSLRTVCIPFTLLLSDFFRATKHLGRRGVYM
jgi:signal transduction histidine kinase